MLEATGRRYREGVMLTHLAPTAMGQNGRIRDSGLRARFLAAPVNADLARVAASAAA